MMRNERVNQIKREDKRALKQFGIIMLLALLTGAVIGLLTTTIGEAIVPKSVQILQWFQHHFIVYANVLLAVITIIPIIYLYQKSKNIYKNWDGENESEIYIGYALWIASVSMELSFLFFALGFSTGFFTIKTFLWWFCGFILVIAMVVIVQQKFVNLQKEINPEKQGSVFEKEFTKKWIESSDEAEMLSIYQSAYKSHKAVKSICPILIAVCIIGSNLWDFGPMPVLMISII